MFIGQFLISIRIFVIQSRATYLPVIYKQKGQLDRVDEGFVFILSIRSAISEETV